MRETIANKVWVNRWKRVQEGERLAEPSFIGDCPTSVPDPTSQLHFTQYAVTVCIAQKDRKSTRGM